LAKMSLTGTVVDRTNIILITDGRANIGIDPIVAVHAEPQIPIYTIGIGGEGSGALFYTDPMSKEKTYLYNESWSLLQSDVDTQLLTEIARISGGTYAKAENALILREKIAQIREESSWIIQKKSQNVRQDISLLFAFFAMIFFFIISIIQKRLYHRGRLI
jgi:hypothetical protein